MQQTQCIGVALTNPISEAAGGHIGKTNFKCFQKWWAAVWRTAHREKKKNRWTDRKTDMHTDSSDVEELETHQQRCDRCKENAQWGRQWRPPLVDVSPCMMRLLFCCAWWFTYVLQRRFPRVFINLPTSCSLPKRFVYRMCAILLTGRTLTARRCDWLLSAARWNSKLTNALTGSFCTQKPPNSVDWWWKSSALRQPWKVPAVMRGICILKCRKL